MKFLIAGAGAIGAYMGACMARAGQDVTLFARGPHLRAMQEHGVRVKSADGDFEAHPKISGNLEQVGPVDVVFLGVKAHGLTQLAPQLKPVLGPDTAVVGTQSGIPWWFFQGWGGEHAGMHLERVDPGGTIAAAIDPGESSARSFTSPPTSSSPESSATPKAIAFRWESLTARARNESAKSPKR